MALNITLQMIVTQPAIAEDRRGIVSLAKVGIPSRMLHGGSLGDTARELQSSSSVDCTVFVTASPGD